ncbi:MAG: hypothetical protein BroJett040_21890 [Oligoflexia bacterium]|nr:MAG: hypothetical protein BroJett040_21890 [Oligoflexia bacterium]
MRLQLVLLFLVSLSAALFAVHWKIDKDFVADKYLWNEVQSRSQITAVSHSIETELKGMVDIVELTFPNIAQTKKDYNQGATDHRALMLGKLKQTPGSSEWILEQKYFAEGSHVQNWAPSYSVLALKSLREESLTPGQPQVLSLVDPQRKPHFLLIVKSASGNGVLVALTKGDLFQGLVDRQKGHISQFAILNQMGQVLGHSVREYIGSQMSDDPMMTEIQKSQSVSGSGFYQSLNNEKVQGFYEQVAETNLYLVVTTPVAKLMAERSKIRFRFILLGIGIGLIGVAALIFLYRPEGRREEEGVVVQAKPALAPTPAPVPVSTAVVKAVPSVPPPPAEKIAAYSQLAAEITQELSAPLTSILAQVRLAKSQAKSEEEMAHLARIENEARTSRDVVEKLSVISGDGQVETQLQSLSNIVRRAVKTIEASAHRAGVKLNVEIEETPELPYPSQLTSAVENLLVNAIESMDRQLDKKLSIQLKSENQSYVLSIQDSGEGMSEETQKRLFEPFFSTRREKHLGMGLAFAQAVFKKSNAEMNIQSQSGEGTLIMVSFHPHQSSEISAQPITDVMKAPVAPVEKLELVQATVEVPAEALLETQGNTKVIPPPPTAPPAVEEIMSGPVDESFEFIEPMNVTEQLIESEIPVESEVEVAAVAAPQIEKPQINMKKRSYQLLEDYEVHVRRPGEHP